MIAVVTIVGLAITASATLASWSLDRHNEERLLRVQTRQAAALISAEVVNITSPLVTALQIATATDGSIEKFTTFMSTEVGSGRLFVDASLWRSTGSSLALVTVVGVTPEPESSPSSESGELVRQAVRSDSFAVAGLPSGTMTRVAYAMADPSAPGYVVLAERAIPSNRQVSVESNAAFANIHFVTYLGDATLSANVATTDVTPSELPLHGPTDRATIPFGNTVITLVTTRKARLGGDLGARLPWIFLAVGSLMTAATAAGAAQLVRRRHEAEDNADTITRLYEQLDERLGEQRHISETLQRALLPQRNPTVPGLEIASRYVAGTRGVEVGGDWYSIVPVDDGHFAFVVGDVSGRGLSAATIMARLRFTLRAYLLEGHLPDRALQMCRRQIDIIEDEHFATVLVGVGNSATREVVLANAGHLNPLLVTDSRAEFVTTHVGVPLGVATSAEYRLTRFTMPEGSTLIAFTDGLVERRGEDLLEGMGRLAAAATTPETALDDSLAGIVTTMNHDGAEDDIAILAFRWIGH
ncbi:MAG: Serine phosphatase RsbU, regulator of sigma subunit [Ilumatobacteraceae bacterium]|nr:Serine phosphatase RsbU, regulator of sigma subunit [Ilumatobacteraceae bacterium]